MNYRRTTALSAAVLALAAAAVPLGSTVTSAQSSPITHVVVIYLENHSFDNLLGYWCNVSPGRCPDGGMPSSVTLSDGTQVTPTVTPDTVPDIIHGVKAQLAAMNITGGVPQMNGWQNIPGGGCGASTGYACISGYQPGQIPNLTALATQFAISDNTFSMADSPSWGGHLYAVMGSLDGFTGDNPVPAPGVTARPGWGCDSDRVAAWSTPSGAKRWIPSCIPDYSLPAQDYPAGTQVNGGAFESTPAASHASILDELDQAGLPWRIYTAASPSDGGYAWNTCASLAECHYGPQDANVVEATQFTTDVAAGNLPAFSLVTAGGPGNLTLSSCHNKFSMTACDNYIGSLVQSVENSPDWSSTAVFIAFDDFGGFYDQVPPPLTPDYVQEGPRIPLLIVSPYARPGYTDTTRATFASILAYVEQNFGLPPMGPDDANAYPFTDAFDYTQKPLRATRMVTRPLPYSARHLKITQADLSDPS